MQSRREFLKQAALLSGGLGSFATIPPSILKAMSIEPDARSTFMDAEHVVILMQENRSFDHAFGTLNGVRGFEDPRAITMPGGNPVWLQTDAHGETFAPFGLDIHGSKSTWMSCLPHDRGSQVAAANNGKHDLWLKEKQSDHEEYADLPLTLGYYDRNDIPFYYAFADAFTICDHYFCSAQSPTTPNRLFLWTGTIRDPRDPQAEARLSNSQIDHNSRANWTTFPERLEDHGISWKIYQNEIYLPTGLSGEEESWLANFGDNPMEYFSQYHVDLSPRHRDSQQNRFTELARKQQDFPPDATEEEKIKQARLRADIEKLALHLDQISEAKFTRLSVREKNLHHNAFTTNSADMRTRKLETLRYQDGETTREVNVPAGDILRQFRDDVNNGKLPAVSWLVAPENFSDHPSAPWYGAWYVSEVLDILTKNPDVWKKTILILNYDENDGYYDHIPPFVPPHSARPESGMTSAGIDTTLEFDTQGHPIGLGFRVPMVIASPWTRGGNVCSQVFDHTSVLQFLEVFLSNKTSAKIEETNISQWRRTICGDLTSAFMPNDLKPGIAPAPVVRNQWVERIHQAKFQQIPDNFKSLSDSEISEIRRDPTRSPVLPEQESGGRLSCPIPYILHAEGLLNRTTKSFEIKFQSGDKISLLKSTGAPFQVYAPGNHLIADAALAEAADPGPLREECRRWSFAVASGDSVAYSWPLAAFDKQIYHLRTYGPNGFYREYRGDMADPQLEITTGYGTDPAGNPTGMLWLRLTNIGSSTSLVTLKDNAYGNRPMVRNVASGESAVIFPALSKSHRWYDLTLTVNDFPDYSRSFAGRVETGDAGFSDPQLNRRRRA